VKYGSMVVRTPTNLIPPLGGGSSLRPAHPRGVRGIARPGLTDRRSPSPALAFVQCPPINPRNRALVDTLREVADELGVTVAQAAIAWVDSRGADVVPLVGARTRTRLTEAQGAVDVTLTDGQLAQIEAAVPADEVVGDRYPSAHMAAWTPSAERSVREDLADCSVYVGSLSLGMAAALQSCDVRGACSA
jgi:hypothetical protein